MMTYLIALLIAFACIGLALLMGFEWNGRLIVLIIVCIAAGQLFQALAK